MPVQLRSLRRLTLTSLLATAVCQGALAYEGTQSTQAEHSGRQYTFAWPYLPDDAMAPRGGTTTGEAVTLATEAGTAWRALQAPGLSAKERDRHAILAMAGPYRASFDFIETVGFTEGYVPAAPYQSWGTEYIYVVADEPDFISLQHIMVIRVATEPDQAAEAMVVKHWRQDWRYQGRELHVFDGHRHWQRETLSRSDAKGKWIQSVYQVDDSPRYAAAGSWLHAANFSSWSSDETWRPLPRREFSVRDDYQVLIGTNKHTITPTGWVQEEHNLKAVLDPNGDVTQMLARENGVARYERIDDFDWAPGDDYWQRTGPFWAIVREVWRELFAENKRLRVAKTANGVPLFVAMFDMAETSTAGQFNAQATRTAIEAALAPYLSR